MDLNKATFTKYGDILYTDELTFTGTDELDLNIVYFTADTSLIDTTSPRKSARYVRRKRVLIRSRT